MDTEAERIAIEVYRRLTENQRRAFNVRINGEEHAATARDGVATIHFPIDGQLMEVSELAFKIIINDGLTSGGGASTNECDNWKYGVNLFPTYQSWLDRYPVGSRINVDCSFGCTCVDYASAFWRGQVNRSIITGNGNAWGTWVLQKDTNMQGGFVPVYQWHQIRKGDWVVWGTVGTGHIGMATSCATSDTSEVSFLEQSGDGTTSGSPVMANNHGPIMGSNKFLGAFRYMPWSVPSC